MKEHLVTCSDASSQSQNLDFDLPQHAGYAGIMGHRFVAELIQSIRSGAPPLITGQDGLKALEVVEAIYQSAESGRSVQL